MKIRIHREGLFILSVLFVLVGALLVFVNYWWPVQTIVHLVLYLGAAAFLIFVTAFFRNPQRRIEADDHVIVSGADGKVVVIEEVEEKEYFKDKRLQLSIYMSSRNVHVNRFPVSGMIKYKKHHKGAFILAKQPKSSYLNERTSVVIDTPVFGEILIRQIAGTVARRIVNNAKQDKLVNQGDEMGMIRFGSRFDFFLPTDVKLEVKLNQKVKANFSVIARKV